MVVQLGIIHPPVPFFVNVEADQAGLIPQWHTEQNAASWGGRYFKLFLKLESLFKTDQGKFSLGLAPHPFVTNSSSICS